jgi:hypothetical protein
MKKPIAIACAFMLMLGTVYADGPGNPRPGANPAPQPNANPAPRPGADSAPDGPATMPAPVGVKNPKKNKVNNGAAHGKKKGWAKNTHNPHNANCNNPGKGRK